MALELQKQFNDELDKQNFDVIPVKENETSFRKRKRSEDDDELNKTQNLVHPQWEILDPTPDVQALFNAFDNKFFQGRLKCVTLEWSKRMYSCAGICYSHKNRIGMAITIRLSEPLLKLRPRKDLIETLLHEMIHAYCSVLGIKEGNGGHGPNFKKIMNGINKIAGTNITVYHTFYDEVSVYKTHWWRCNGICQNRKPFFGYVKRTSNRPPGPNDIWWKQHVESCGGSFLKVREPEKPTLKKKSNKENERVHGTDVRKYFTPQNKITSIHYTPKEPLKSNGSGTVLVKPKTISNQPITSTPAKNKIFSNVGNIFEFKDLDDSTKTQNSTSSGGQAMIGTGYSLTSTNTNPKNTETDKNDRKVDREKIRDIWTKKYQNPSQSDSSNLTKEENKEDVIVEDSQPTSSTSNSNNHVLNLDDVENNDWIKVDDEIMIRDKPTSVINISSDEDDVEEESDNISTEQNRTRIKLPTNREERQHQIKQEIIETTDLDMTEDDIELIDDEYDDTLANINTEITDTSLIDDFFGEDTLLKEFHKENADIATSSRYQNDPRNDIVTCPICQEKIKRENLSDHLDGCIGISTKLNPMSSFLKSNKDVPFDKKQQKKISSRKITQTLKKFGYNSDEIEEAVLNENNENEGVRRRVGLNTSTHACPVCAQEVNVNQINDHLDVCLKK